MVSPRHMDAAQKALSTLISGRRRSSGDHWEHAFGMMAAYLKRLKLDERLDELKVIHIAGTKGKGSTAAFVESILRHSGYTTGLFTSPHLMDVRERIRIDGKLVSEEVFLRYFWECFDNFQDQSSPDAPGMPAYFRFLTLLGLKIFLEEKVDVVILEVGLGGRLDATNCVRHPVVCGVASLGLDHMDILGHTLPEIAKEKAGIFKKGVPAFTLPQPADAMEQLEHTAKQVGASLAVCPSLEAYQTDSGCTPKLGIPGAHQAVNGGLAVALTRTFEEQCGTSQPAAARVERLRQGHLPATYVKGLEMVKWPGRGQIVEDLEFAAPAGTPSRLTFFLDGAHTAESTTACAEWFSDCVLSGSLDANVQNVLLFNCQEERSPETLLEPVVQIFSKREVPLHRAIFAPPDSLLGKIGKRDGSIDLAWQHQLRVTWDRLYKKNAAMRPVPTSVPDSAVLPNLKAVLELCRKSVRESPNLRLRVLVTGSLYIVGDMLSLLGIRIS